MVRDFGFTVGATLFGTFNSLVFEGILAGILGGRQRVRQRYGAPSAFTA